MILSVFDRVENIMGKGKNAGYQHFLHFPQYFEKVSFPNMSKGVIVWEWVKRTRWPRWPWIAHLNFLHYPSQFFLLLSEKNLQEFLYVHTVQVAPVH